MGDGIPPDLARLVTKIRHHEMGELLAKIWSGQKDKDTDRRDSKLRRGRKVIDIFTCLQC